MSGRPRAILFDWDNTLVDSWLCLQDAMNTTLAAMGHPIWDLAETKRRVAQSMKDAFPKMFGERWPEARDIFHARFAAIHLQHLKALPGIPHILERLKQADIPMGVVSNKTGSFIRREAEQLGWTPYFAKLVGAGDAIADKPSDAPVRLVLDHIGIAADTDVWFIGDAAIDMQCAVNAGLSGFLLRHDSWTEDEFTQCEPRQKFQSWEAFGRFLDEILIP